MIVTIRTCPVTVSKDVTGVGVHVRDELLDELEEGADVMGDEDLESYIKYVSVEHIRRSNEK